MSGRRGAYRCRILIAVLTCILITGLLPQTALAKASDAPVYRYGTVRMQSSAAAGTLLTDEYCYTDDWFRADPAVRNDALALVSMQLTAAVAGEASHGTGTAFLQDLGFAETGTVRDDSRNPEDCGFAWGKKMLTAGGTSCMLVAVSILNYSDDKAVKCKGWTQNFTVNGQTAQGEHAAYRVAAEKAASEIAALCSGQDVKIWITGQSRGGALANLTAAKLPDRLGAANRGIYAYTFEAPATVPAEQAGMPAAYSGIHNYVCSDDIVTMIPPWEMSRYGNVHQLKTKQTDAELKAQLQKLGSPMANMDLKPSDGKIQKKIVSQLVSVIPARADYSARKTDTFTDDQGSTAGITYVYQDAFRDLMGVIFAGSFSGLSLETVIEHADQLVKVAEAMAEGGRASGRGDAAGAAKAYWQATQDFTAFAESIGLRLSLTDADIYALLKLLSPVVIDTAYQPAAGDDAITRILGYLMPGIELYGQKDELIASHHYDTLLARLHTLAAAPEAMKIKVKTGARFQVKKTVTMKKGRSIRIKAVAVKASGTLGDPPAGVRYVSSDQKIAAATDRGVVKAKKKGTCRITAYAQNGVTQSIRITVR